MANLKTDISNYENIADAIREKNKLSTTYTPAQMADAINNLDEIEVIPGMNFCYSTFTSVDVSNIRGRESRTSMNSCFWNCNNLQSLDLSSWDMRVINQWMYAFSFCERLQSINFGNKCPDVATIGLLYVFYGCERLSSLDMSKWKGNVTNIRQTWQGCTSLQSLDVRNLNFTTATTYTDAFKNVPTNCEIIVKDQDNKDWFATKFPSLTNVHTPV